MLKEASVQPPGSVGTDRLVVNSQCARIRLNGVVIKNKGIDWQNEENVYWQHKVTCTSIIFFHFLFVQPRNLGAEQRQQGQRKG